MSILIIIAADGVSGRFFGDYFTWLIASHIFFN